MLDGDRGGRHQAGIDSPDLQLQVLGKYLLDGQTHEFRSSEGHCYRCSNRQFQVLHRLMMARGRPLSLERLMRQIYGSVYEPDPSTLRVVISQLNGRLAEAGMPGVIRNARGVGYHIVADVVEMQILVLDRSRQQALAAVLDYAAATMPSEVAMLALVRAA